MTRSRKPYGYMPLIREAIASVRIDRGETIDLGPHGKPPEALGDKLRELRAEVADGGKVWCSTLDTLAAQADELERDRALWRDRIKRVRAEAASWDRVDEPGEPSATAATAIWCSERIRFALDD